MSYHHVGPIETLNHAWRARIDLWVLCRGCGHVRRLKAANLIADRGAMPLAKLREKFVCLRCRQRRAAIILHDVSGPGR